MAKKTGSSRKKVVNIEPAGQAHIHASFNNIIISMTK
jgi:small subunit ribosomal protein S11